MAGRYGAGQYEDAFTAPRLPNWSVARPCRQRPSPRDGSTQPIANDRGHLLPSVPRSQLSPWGTFLGTWEMPPRIPPPHLSLTARSAAAAARLHDWIRNSSALTEACNGIRVRITGKPQQSCGTPPSGTTEPMKSTEDAPGEQPPPTAMDGDSNEAKPPPEGDPPPSAGPE